MKPLTRHRTRWIFRATLVGLLLFGSHFGAVAQEAVKAPARPNVVLVITDDQGYGDVGAHGNTMIQTPNLDRLHAQSVRLTDFHVDPTCAPSRSALMTGRYSSRVGVWHTIMGRSLLRRDEVTMANVFSDNEYRTGMFGKWHLGDNYPYRPQDRGFDDVFRHGGGGVGQTPDFWGNDYFDDTYFRNGTPEKADGYCTDVWFDNALDFIEANRRGPFFCYVATNAPHGPYLVEERYSKPYADQGVPSPMAEFYGMITNIDDNMARLTQKLDELGLTENTILIFMTDNGTAAGVSSKPGTQPDRWTGFNDGMRGRKGSQYEGGHRVPCFLHWPAGGLYGGHDIDQLTAHVDLLPTLTTLCGLRPPAEIAFDGTDLTPLLMGQTANWPDRTLFVESHRIDHPEPWRMSAVMTEQWRLIDGSELFDKDADPGQTNDLAATNPEVVKRLRVAYERRYVDVSRRFGEYCPISIGTDHENPAWITAHDWHAPTVPWNHGMVRKMPYLNGFWSIDVETTGRYRFALRNQPKEADLVIEAKTARLKIGDVDLSKPIPEGATAVEFELDLPAGETRLDTWLTDEDGQERGAFFVEAELLP